MESLLSDSIFWRGFERVLIIVSSVICIYLGFKLFRYGIEKGRSKLKANLSESLKIVFSGQGPGLFFMAFGAIVLIVALMKGGARSSQTEQSQLNTDRVLSVEQEISSPDPDTIWGADTIYSVDPNKGLVK